MTLDICANTRAREKIPQNDPAPKWQCRHSSNLRKASNSHSEVPIVSRKVAYRDVIGSKKLSNSNILQENHHSACQVKS